MKRRMQQILSILCVLALMIGCVSFVSLAEGAEEIRIVCVEWDDENNYDKLRDAVEITCEGTKKAVLNADNNWASEMLVPAGAELAASEVAGYGKPVWNSDGTIVTYTHQVKKDTVTGEVTWNDSENAAGIRPESVQIRLPRSPDSSSG